MSSMIGQFEICRDRHMDAVGYNRGVSLLVLATADPQKLDAGLSYRSLFLIFHFRMSPLNMP